MSRGIFSAYFGLVGHKLKAYPHVSPFALAKALLSQSVTVVGGAPRCGGLTRTTLRSISEVNVRVLVCSCCGFCLREQFACAQRSG